MKLYIISLFLYILMIYHTYTYKIHASSKASLINELINQNINKVNKADSQLNESKSETKVPKSRSISKEEDDEKNAIFKEEKIHIEVNCIFYY